MVFSFGALACLFQNRTDLLELLAAHVTGISLFSHPESLPDMEKIVSWFQEKSLQRRLRGCVHVSRSALKRSTYGLTGRFMALL